MIQLVYKNKLYICGKLPDVIAQLKEISPQFKTVKEFLEFKTKPQ